MQQLAQFDDDQIPKCSHRQGPATIILFTFPSLLQAQALTIGLINLLRQVHLLSLSTLFALKLCSTLLFIAFKFLPPTLLTFEPASLFVDTVLRFSYLST